jgi:hypothetical protein
MSLSWIRLALVSLSVLLPARVFAVDVAVMPIQGVNLSEGESDAIGVLFANAFASEAHAVVASPMHTKPLRAEGKASAAIAGQLGATRYVELKAVQLGQRTDVSGILYGQDGRVLYRADISAWSLETMDAAMVTLARSLAFRQPIPAGPLPYAPGAPPVASYEAPPAPPEHPNPNRVIHDHGVKVGIAVPHASGKSFSPGVLIEFDGRYGPRNYFLEFGAGLMIPTDENNYDYNYNYDYYSSSRRLRATSGFLEIGGSYYLWSSNTAAYLGGGLSPAFWVLEDGNDSSASATCGAYGQAGITFTRDARIKLFAEFRLTQLLLAVASHADSSDDSGTHRPMILAFQGGLVW